MSPGVIRALHLITGLRAGGAETMLYRLVSSADKNRFEHHVISLTDIGTIGLKLKSLAVPVHALGLQPGAGSLTGLAALIKLSRSLRPGILQGWMYHGNLAALIAGSALRGVRVSWNLRCSVLGARDAPLGTRLLARLLGVVSGRPDVVIVNSEAGRLGHVRIGYRPRRWEVIHNGFDTACFAPDVVARKRVRKSLGVAEETPLIGLVARYHPMKDHDNFLQAAALLVARRPDVRFLLAGYGVEVNNERLMGRVRSLGLEHCVHLLGERQDVPALTAALDIACSSSSGEGFPNTVGEAMACGVPCVVTNVGDSAFLLGEGGIVVPPRDPKALADACEHLLSIPAEKRASIGAKGRARIEAEFRIQEITARYEQVYAELAQQE